MKPQHILDARKTLETQRQLILIRAVYAAKIAEAIKTVAHHQNITVKVQKAIKQLLGEDWGVSYGATTWGATRIEISNYKLLPYSEGIGISGKSYEELIRDCARYDGNTQNIDKTLSNLDKVQDLYNKLKQLKIEVDENLPALHYVNNQLDELYKVHCLYMG